MKTFIAELHVHTVLSPCAEVEMLPPLIVQEALDRDINLIAITDHNASGNVAAVQKAALGTELAVLPGMELQTREEVHVLCLFDTPEQMAAWQAVVDALLPGMQNNADFFGDQLIVDETGEFLRRETRLLLTSADLTLQEAVQGVQKLGGLAIPAHINRKAFGLIENLGLIPEDVPFDALEISRHLSVADARKQIPRLDAYPVVQGGDVHRLEEFLGRNLFRMAAPSVSEIRRALRNEEGRAFTLRSVRTA